MSAADQTINEQRYCNSCFLLRRRDTNSRPLRNTHHAIACHQCIMHTSLMCMHSIQRSIVGTSTSMESQYIAQTACVRGTSPSLPACQCQFRLPILLFIQFVHRPGPIRGRLGPLPQFIYRLGQHAGRSPKTIKISRTQ